VTRGEFDHSVVEYAHGKQLSEILGVSYRKDGKIVHNALRPQLHTEELDALPFATDIYNVTWNRTLTRAVPAATLCIVLHHARMPGALHVLHVAANDFGACLANAFDGKTWRGK